MRQLSSRRYVWCYMEYPTGAVQLLSFWMVLCSSAAAPNGFYMANVFPLGLFPVIITQVLVLRQTAGGWCFFHFVRGQEDGTSVKRILACQEDGRHVPGLLIHFKARTRASTVKSMEKVGTLENPQDTGCEASASLLNLFPRLGVG